MVAVQLAEVELEVFIEDSEYLVRIILWQNIETEGVNKDDEYQKGVCTDYAFLFQTLCEGAGIECSSISNTTHRWNEVVIDGQPLEIDVCWNDDDYTNEYRSQYYLIPRASMAQYPSHGNWDLKL